MKHGIDISNHNGDIDFQVLSKQIDFIIIRAGYGQNNIDLRCLKNIEGCKKYNIPFGLYWFSYALNEQQSKNEANYLCNIADKCNPILPLCYDYEYDSDDYVSRKGGDKSKTMMLKKARAFLETVKSRGYKPMIYTNLDYMNRGFGELTNQYSVWLAQWGVNSPSITCDIWQSSEKGKYNGINGNVDLDTAYFDFNSKLNNTSNETPTKTYKLTDKLKDTIEKNISNYFWADYTKIANDVIAGKYGNGLDRKNKLESLGYNYDIVQIFVNAFLGVI